MPTTTTVLLFSGGLDSTVLLYALRASQRIDVIPVAFDYGQLHVKELEAARRLEPTTRELRLPPIARPSSSVPDVDPDHAEASVMVFPNRNMVMLAVAASCALQWGAGSITAAFHMDDGPAFPDCRREFVEALRRALELAIVPASLGLRTPHLGLLKGEVVRLGHELKVPFEQTWSCYRAGRLHCGRCPACRGRRKAFVQAQVADPTEYE